MTIERVWAMPSRWTFTIAPIRRLLGDELTPGDWIDPFAGKHSPADLTNDLNPDMPTAHHLDALAFLRQQPDGSAAGALFDPPYSMYQAKTCYEAYGTKALDIRPDNMAYWARVKDELARIVKPGGKVICFGWSSGGLGKGRGFAMTRALLVYHGGSRNDTIVTVEVKR